MVLTANALTAALAINRVVESVMMFFNVRSKMALAEAKIPAA
jgi:hypothetical protein